MHSSATNTQSYTNSLSVTVYWTIAMSLMSGCNNTPLSKIMLKRRLRLFEVGRQFICQWRDYKIKRLLLQSFLGGIAVSRKIPCQQSARRGLIAHSITLRTSRLLVVDR